MAEFSACLVIEKGPYRVKGLLHDLVTVSIMRPDWPV